jgi:hypothetical protein
MKTTKDVFAPAVELGVYDQRHTHTSRVWHTIQYLRLRYVAGDNGKNFYGIPTGKITQKQLQQMLLELELAWEEEAK